MERKAEELAEREHDVLVVGGGILGAMVAWDASLRGLEVALVEQADFASSTSANSLKIVHGGLRYLRSLAPTRARESIRERSAWLRIAPHLVETLPVLVGAHRGSLRRRPVLWAGTRVADLFGFRRNRGLPPERHLPAGRLVSRSECVDLAPELEHPDLTGGLLFYDGQMYNSERLVVETVRAAADEGAVVANYARLIGPLRRGSELVGARVFDRLDGTELEVRARVVVNAAGASTDAVARLLTGHDLNAAPAWTLAMNLVLEGRGHDVAFALPTAQETESRQLFFVPWRGRTLVGTGHYPWDGGPPEAWDHDVVGPYLDRFRSEIGRAWPHGRIPSDAVLDVHAGLLPAERPRKNGPSAAGRLLRRRRVVDHAEHGTPNAITGVSVKYTTARLLAEELTDLVCRKVGRRSRRCATSETPLPGARGPSPAELRSRAIGELEHVLPAEVVEHLLRTYGATYDSVVAHRGWMNDWSRPVAEGSPVIRAQLAHGAIEEMARRPDDLLERRTEVGATARGDDRSQAAARDVLRRVADLRKPSTAAETERRG